MYQMLYMANAFLASLGHLICRAWIPLVVRFFGICIDLRIIRPIFIAMDHTPRCMLSKSVLCYIPIKVLIRFSMH